MLLSELLNKNTWLVSVKGHGDSLFIGTDAEADGFAEGKASWEGTTATKKRIGTLRHAILDDGMGTTSLDNFIERFVTPPNPKGE